MKRGKKVLCSILSLALLCILALPARAAEVVELAPPKYSEVRDFKEGLAAVKVDSGEKDGQGRIIYRWGFIDRTGKEIIAPKYVSVGDFSNGLSKVTMSVGQGEDPERYGFIDQLGNEVVPIQYVNANDFSEGFARVRLNRGDKDVFINQTGQIAIRPIENAKTTFSDGLAQIYTGKTSQTYINGRLVSEEYTKYGFIDQTGQAVIPPKYHEVTNFNNGFAQVKLYKSWGFIDTAGREIVRPQYDETRSFTEDGMALVYLNERWGYVDQLGQEVIAPQYERATAFHGGLAMVRQDKKWGGIDKTGKVIIPFEYDDLSGYADATFSFGGISKSAPRAQSGYVQEGLMAVKWNGKWGFIDALGNKVIPAQFDSASYFSEGLAVVEIEGKCGYADKTGQLMIPAQYEAAGPFNEGVAWVWQDGWGLIDKTGREITPHKYKDFGAVMEGVAWVQDEESRKWGLIAVRDTPTAYASTQSVLVDGKKVEFQMYALRDEKGNPTNYVKLRDVASVLNGTAARFEVGWDKDGVTITTGKPYTPNGSEMTTPFSGDRAYETPKSQTRVNGQGVDLEAIILTDDRGGQYTYYKLRDLGTALGFKVDWSKEKGVFIETK